MRNLIVIALIASSAAAARAQSRPDTLNMSCRQASALVQAHGSAVLATGPNLYDRYVTSCNFCFDDETLQPAWVRTTDNGQCAVGYTCTNESRFSMPNCGATGYRGPSVQP